MVEAQPLLHEPDVVEMRRIADLALDTRKVRDRSLEKVPDAGPGAPEPARGEHNAVDTIAMNGVLASKPEFVALRQAIAALPRVIREKLWVVTQIGRGDAAVLDWDIAIATAEVLSDDNIADNLSSDAYLHDCLRKGLYELRVAAPPGNAE